MGELKGSFWTFLLYDVSERIELDRARIELGGTRRERGPEFGERLRTMCGSQNPPVVYEPAGGGLVGESRVHCVVKLYDYGVITVALELVFDCGWAELAELSNRWIGSTDIERECERIAQEQVRRIEPALENAYEKWTTEDYYVVHLREALDGNRTQLSAKDLVTTFRSGLAQIVRGESMGLSDAETSEILGQWLSYYPNDLVVVGWMAAFLYDTPEGASPLLQLLEYANTQLLEFRYYDDLLTRVLADVYRRLEHRRGLFRRWRTGHEAERLNRIRLDVIELTEQVDNSIKFLGDMYYTRVYRLSARKIGVTDYRDLVDEKLSTAAQLYESMVNEFHQGRAFVLEAMVVAILIIELVFLFRGIP